jgi:teichuronic acid biosynthesis glycosyltransferase TuaC
MKILYVTNMYPHQNNPYYGIFVKEQIDAVSALDGTESRDIKTKLIFINSKRTLLAYIWSVFSINFHLCFNRYDIIHIHYGLSGVFLLFNFFTKTPVVVTFHGGDIQKERKRPVQNFISKRLAKRSALCIVLNDRMEAAVKDLCKKTLKAPCGIDTDTFMPVSVPEERNGYTVVFPGSSHIAVKNYPLFEKVIIEARRKINEPVEIIEIKNMTRPEVASALNKADCLMMSSFSEGSPQIIKEAMACDLPIVSTKVGDVEDLIKGADNCYTAEESTPECLLEQLLKVLNSGRRSLNGRQKIFEMGLDSRSVALKIYRSYTQIIN